MATNEFKYELSFAGTPFIIDRAAVLRMNQPQGEKRPDYERHQPPRKHQPVTDLIDELDLLIPKLYLQDFAAPGMASGRNLNALAQKCPSPVMPTPEVRIGDWYYPTGACRWSVFRGLATSEQLKEMLEVTQGGTPQPFIMKCVPIGAGNAVESTYTLTSDMYMLAPRAMVEHGGKFNGLYLITLVDERYWWQGTPTNLRVTATTTWANLITELATALGISINYSAIQTEYSQPEPDSQLWSRMENAPVLLDAVAFNLGRTLVRHLDGTFNLYTPGQSAARVELNRGDITELIRRAGGDMFQSGGTLKAGNLFLNKNSVVPSSVRVTFPQYVVGDDPVPHFVNQRYNNQRPSAWFEEGYGGLYSVDVPIASGGLPTSGYTSTSGLTGTSTVGYVHTTAKAFYSGEAQASGHPVNRSGITALAMQIARDYYGSKIAAALDEVYPGTYNLFLEGLHDVVWTYSARHRQASARVLRTGWNEDVSEMQHAGPPLSGTAVTPRGVGGPSVAQTIRDSISGTVQTTLAAPLASGGYTATFADIDAFPTQQRWKGLLDSNELVLFEGTSGGTSVGIVYRGYDGTIEQAWPSGTTVSRSSPHTVYGVNLTTYGPGQYVFPDHHTSGGIQGLRVIPQTQTVRVLCGSGTSINGRTHYSGEVLIYRTAEVPDTEYAAEEPVWIVERNAGPVLSGSRYDGQFYDYSLSGTVAPVYGISQGLIAAGQSGDLTVREVGTAGFTGINILEFDPNDRFAVSNPVAGTARVDLTYQSGDLNASGLIVEGWQSGATVVDVIRLQFINRDGFSVTDIGGKVARVGWSGSFGGSTYSGLTTREVDGTPTIATTSVLEFLQSTGIGLSDQTGGTGRVYLSGIPRSIITNGDKEKTYFRQVTVRFNSGGQWFFGGIPHEHSDVTFNVGNGGMHSDRYYCLPFYEARGGYLDQIAIWVTQAAQSGKFRLGIYDNYDDAGDHGPATLIYDCGEIAAPAGGLGSTGLRTLQISGFVNLDPQSLYWLVLNSTWWQGTAPQLKVLDPIDCWCLLGNDDLWETNSAIPGWYASGTYGAMPATFLDPSLWTEYRQTGTQIDAVIAMGVTYGG